MKYRGRCLAGNRQNPSGRRQMAGPGFHKTYYNKNNGNPASGMSLFFYNVFCNFLVTVQTALCDFLYYLLKLRRSKMAFRPLAERCPRDGKGMFTRSSQAMEMRPVKCVSLI